MSRHAERRLTVDDRRAAALEQFELAQQAGGGDWKAIAAMLAAAMPPPKWHSDPAFLAQWDSYKPIRNMHWRKVEVQFERGGAVVEAPCSKGRPINWGYAVRKAYSVAIMRQAEKIARGPHNFNCAFAHTGSTERNPSYGVNWEALTLWQAEIEREIDLGQVTALTCDGIECEVLPEIPTRKPAPVKPTKPAKRRGK